MSTSLLTRTLRIGSQGKDVEGAKRTIYRYLDQRDGGRRLHDFNSKPVSVRRTVGPAFLTDVVKVRRLEGFDYRPVFGPQFWEYLAKKGYPDALAIDLMNQYIDEHKPAPKPPQLVEPYQGFDSLVKDLWPLFTTGRNMGLLDGPGTASGTYNPESTLPSGAPSDHATSRKSGRIGKPACAFDLGFTPATGYAHPVARAFFHMMAGRPEVSYVILGNRIWSVERGLHSYTYGGHEGHVHVSGHRR